METDSLHDIEAAEGINLKIFARICIGRGHRNLGS